jgi:hypothetical protein
MVTEWYAPASVLYGWSNEDIYIYISTAILRYLYLFISYLLTEFNWWDNLAKNGTRTYCHVSQLAVHNTFKVVTLSLSLSLLARTIYGHQWRTLWKYICQCDLVSGYDANMRNHFQNLVNLVFDWIHAICNMHKAGMSLSV